MGKCTARPPAAPFLPTCHCHQGTSDPTKPCSPCSHPCPPQQAHRAHLHRTQGKAGRPGSPVAVPALCLPESGKRGDRGAGASGLPLPPAPENLTPPRGSPLLCTSHLLPAHTKEPCSEVCAPRPLLQGPHLGQRQPAKDALHPPRPGTERGRCRPWAVTGPTPSCCGSVTRFSSSQLSVPFRAPRGTQEIGWGNCSFLFRAINSPIF